MGLRDGLRRLIGRAGTTEVGRYGSAITAADEIEGEIGDLEDAELRQAYDDIRGDLDDVPTQSEFCAVVREAAERGIGERPYDVQLQGALAIMNGTVVQMATGEGKTLAGAIAALGLVARGHRARVMSVNDYLARRDAEWMAPIYELLGVSVGWVTSASDHDQRKAAYAADICYGSVSEIGFDLLRDRLRTDTEQIVQTKPDALIIDEADSVMIDEAKVPLVLAGSLPVSDDGGSMAAIVTQLAAGKDYETSDDNTQVNLTDSGLARVEALLGVDDLYAEGNELLLTRVNVALYAETLVQRDVDYIVTDDHVRLVDPNRGRVAEQQRWPDGLHAAVEAKEGLQPSDRGEILDTITVQALIKHYGTVGGMTGTALAAAEQFREFYDLETGALPPHRPLIRTDEADRIYETAEDRDAAMVELIKESHDRQRPVLIGTHSVAGSEKIAELLAEVGVEAAVLNAKNDTEEAAVIAAAGQLGAVTVSTQMAGRGVDIKLGGGDEHEHDQVAELGGLLVIGHGRYHTSRLDDQLRGRAGRQGDPGTSVIFVSLEDDPTTAELHPRGAEIDDETGEITSPRIAGQVDHAQRITEGALLDTHRNSWNYSQQLDAQRTDVLSYRDRVLRTGLAAEEFQRLRPDRWKELAEEVEDEVLAEAARQLLLHQIDRAWSDHIAFTEDLREGIHLRALGRETPLMAYHSASDQAYRELRKKLLDDAAEAFEKAVITEDGLDEAASGIDRPTSTWTYMVDDQAFGSPEDRFLNALGGVIRRAVRGD
ncbi:protein translocase subunit SecA 2 [Microlunatus endophyticus]|uniref:Protein translocase subunit SecA n=1 Tax=Microlunatus endophyticus TaxID=1716077 RepID=A0A917W5I6_9ACTN|nr:accessory Sec system translocase SecA2 [Microlunatus endophyticus]GGL65639.1 protein translocase subunit SecA 2 [Microlunatus endophyticus]